MHSNLAQAAIAALFCQGILAGSALRLCLDDRAELRMPARAALVQELIRLFPGADLVRGCQDGAVAIALHGNSAGHPPDALGAMAVFADGAIHPPVLVFVDAVARHSAANSEEALGLALARVAGHELLHFLRQSREHSDSGLLQERLSAGDLTGKPGPTAWVAHRSPRGARR